jgi:hypothetical protein
MNLGGNEKMTRLLAAVLVTCCLMAQLNAQASKDDASKDQTSKDQPSKDQPSKKEEGSAVQTASAPSAKTQWPLDAFTEFSAVMVGSIIPNDDRESYIYRSGKLMRNPGPEGRNFVITDLTTLETYGVAPTGCMHDQHPYFRSVPFSLVGPGVTVERAASGQEQETVDGHSCKIEDVIISSPKLLKPMKLRFWEAEDLQGFPVKVQIIRGFGHDPVIRYKNVVLGPQDPTLFIYPHSCEKSPGWGKNSKAAPGAKKPAAKPPASPPPN